MPVSSSIFVILASAATLHAAGKTNIQTATEAAEALKPLSSGLASILFALGLIGSGFLAVPVLTGSSAYAIGEAFGWKCGLDEKFRGAPRFYLIIIASTLVGMLINFLKIEPVTALFWTAVINGVLAPPLLVMIMLVSNNRKVMGDRVNGRLTNFIGWTAVAVMSAAALGMFLTWESRRSDTLARLKMVCQRRAAEGTRSLAVNRTYYRRKFWRQIR